MIDAAGALSLAMLELLVQRGRFVATLIVTADVPDDVAVTDLTGNPPPNWRVIGSVEARRASEAWLDERRRRCCGFPRPSCRKRRTISSIRPIRMPFGFGPGRPIH